MKIASTEFNKCVNGPNFMTPDVIEYGFINKCKGNYVYELSEGDFLDDHLIGVTIMNTETKSAVNEWCEMFYDEQEAREFIEQARMALT